MSRTRRNFSAKFKSELVIEGIEDAPKQKEDFWNTINGNKVNINLLTDDDVEIVLHTAEEKHWYQYRDEVYEKIATQWCERYKIDIVE